MPVKAYNKYAGLGCDRDWPAIVSADKAEMTGITYDRMVAAHVHERGKGEVAA